MSTAAVSIYSELQSFFSNRQTDLKQLGSALQSGNLSDAQQAYNTLVTLGQGGPSANAEPFSKSSRAQAFETIGQDLQSGDLAGAQAAFATLTSKASNSTSSATTTPAVVVNIGTSSTNSSVPVTSNSTSIYQQLQAYQQARHSDLVQLGQDLKAGNLSAVQQDVITLTALGQTGPNANGQLFQRSDRGQDFQAITQAVQSGDLTGAQSAFTSLASTFGQGLSGSGSGKHVLLPPTYGPPTNQPPVTTPPVYATPIPPVLQGPPVRPHVTAPPVGTTTPGSVAEIVINLGGTSTTSAPNGSATPEIVINIQEGNSSSASSRAAEIDINFGSALNANPSTASSSTTAAQPELVINLGQGSNSSTGNPEEVTINLGGNSSASQISIESGQGQNGSKTEQIAINLNQQTNVELILNLLSYNSTIQAQNSSNALSVQA
jgi:hypothetical protein